MDFGGGRAGTLANRCRSLYACCPRAGPPPASKGSTRKNGTVCGTGHSIHPSFKADEWMDLINLNLERIKRSLSRN
jgi:hypothetical protein